MLGTHCASRNVTEHQLSGDSARMAQALGTEVTEAQSPALRGWHEPGVLAHTGLLSQRTVRPNEACPRPPENKWRSKDRPQRASCCSGLVPASHISSIPSGPTPNRGMAFAEAPPGDPAWLKKIRSPSSQPSEPGRALGLQARTGHLGCHGSAFIWKLFISHTSVGGSP